MMSNSPSDMEVFIEAIQLPCEQRAQGFLEQPAGAFHAAMDKAAAWEKPGDTIDRYKLLKQIGEGGCGMVFVAEQQSPVQRLVALKVIKRGMDTRSVIARFEAERQALALMDHPNIAHVFDAGTSESGRPFFVMELVEGVKITDYCDQLPCRPALVWETIFERFIRGTVRENIPGHGLG
jgi:serine/threonine protein kinase